jgi:hypothetical protein
MKALNGSYYQEVSDAPITYLGGEVLTPNGSSTAATLPTGTNYILIGANGADTFYAINPGAGAASATSAGFITAGEHWFVGPLVTLTSFKVFTASGAGKVHLEYYAA